MWSGSVELVGELFKNCPSMDCKYRVSQKKGTNGMLLEPRWTSSITSSRRSLGLENAFLARFLLRLSRIKLSQDISTGKFGPTALNFGYGLFY